MAQNTFWFRPVSPRRSCFRPWPVKPNGGGIFEPIGESTKGCPNHSITAQTVSRAKLSVSPFKGHRARPHPQTLPLCCHPIVCCSLSTGNSSPTILLPSVLVKGRDRPRVDHGFLARPPSRIRHFLATNSHKWPGTKGHIPNLQALDTVCRQGPPTRSQNDLRLSLRRANPWWHGAEMHTKRDTMNDPVAQRKP